MKEQIMGKKRSFYEKHTNNTLIASLLIISLSSCLEIKADVVNTILNLRKIDANTRAFLDKISDIKDSAGVLNNKFSCMSKNKDNNFCAKQNCSNIKECLHSIFIEFNKILDPIMIYLIGKIDKGELKPGAITGLPLLWQDPKGEKVTKMQNMLVNNVAVNFNDIYNFISLLAKSLDPNLTLEEKKDALPVTVEPQNADKMQLSDAPLPVKKKRKKKKKKKAAEEAADTSSSSPDTTPATEPEKK